MPTRANMLHLKQKHEADPRKVGSIVRMLGNDLAMTLEFFYPGRDHATAPAALLALGRWAEGANSNAPWDYCISDKQAMRRPAVQSSHATHTRKIVHTGGARACTHK